LRLRCGLFAKDLMREDCLVVISPEEQTKIIDKLGDDNFSMRILFICLQVRGRPKLEALHLIVSKTVIY
jgi:hypothetical protein